MMMNVEVITITQYCQVTIDKLLVDNESEIKMELSVTTTTNRKIKIDFDEISAIWYRRGNLKNEKFNDLPHSKEWEIIKSIILNYNRVKVQLGCYYFERDVNKLEMLLKAKDVGFNIPSSLVSANLNTIKAFVSERINVIHKPLKRIKVSEIDSKPTVTRTVDKLNVALLEPCQDINYPHYLQTYIDKKYELRLSVLKEKIYAMCIFSQISEKASVDFRNDYKGIRLVPFKLSRREQEIISNFMNAIDEDSGSLDIIMTNENELCFLEINPTGQFDFVSKNCNYDIEKQIAELLSSSVGPAMKSIEKPGKKMDLTKSQSNETIYVEQYNNEVNLVNPFYKYISRL